MFSVKNKDERHYLTFGRWASVAFGVIMIALALLIHFTRTRTIQDLQAILGQVLTAGLFALFMLGLITRRVGNKAAVVATILTVFTACLWLFLDSAYGRTQFPTIAEHLPVKFWFGSLLNIQLFLLAVVLSYTFNWKNKKDITDLSIRVIDP